jgi:hypothetical protein
MTTITFAEAEVGMTIEIGPVHKRIRVTILNLRPYGSSGRLITMRNEDTGRDWTSRHNSGSTTQLITNEGATA